MTDFKSSTRIFVGASALVIILGLAFGAIALCFSLMNAPDTALVVFGLVGLFATLFVSFRAGYFIARILFGR